MKKWKTILLLIIAGCVLSGCFFAPQSFDEKAWLEQVQSQDAADLYAPHFEDGKFFNPWMEDSGKNFLRFLRWRFSRSQSYSAETEEYLPQVIPELLSRIKQLSMEQDFLVWLGHATFLLRIDGVWFLTDPMLSKRAMIPKRYIVPALSKRELAGLDGPLHVLVSHNHYDHLDVSTIMALPDDAVIHVPLGLKEYVERFHPGDVDEYDWWATGELTGGVLTCLPAQHWSRSLWHGTNSTLWASWMVQKGNRVIYYGGDSGYFIGYQEFRNKFPHIDYALLPITAYHPRWFMHYSHVNVNEAIMSFQDLGARYFVPTQWGTFRLGDNPPGFPMLELEKEIADLGPEASRYLRLQPGEILFFNED